MKQNKPDIEKPGIPVISLQMTMINKTQCNTLYLSSLILHLSTYCITLTSLQFMFYYWRITTQQMVVCLH